MVYIIGCMLERGSLILRGLIAVEIAASGAAYALPKVSDTSQDNLPTPIVLQSPSPWSSSEPQVTINPTPLSTETPTPVVISPEPINKPTPESKVINEINLGLGSEPSITVSPIDPNLLAATYVQIKPGCIMQTVVLSQDGGLSWKSVKTQPMKQGCSGAHARIAFDEENTLWLENAYFTSGGVSDAIAYSKNLGKTWAVQPRKDAKPWVGRFPDIATDTNPASPNYGVVAATYNFNKGNAGSGIRVVVSGDKGKSWKSVDVPPIAVEGYPTNWLINSQLKALPNGDWILSYADTAMKGIGLKDPVNDWRGAYKYTVYATTLIHYDKVQNKVTAEIPVAAIRLSSAGDVEWQSEMGVDDSGGVFLAVSGSGKINLVYDNSNISKLDGYQRGTPPEPAWVLQYGMNGQSLSKPSLAVKGDMVFLGFHATDKRGIVRTYYMISYDKGKNFSPPQLATKTTYGESSVRILNGVGLREQAVAGPDGKIYWAIGVGNKGKPNVEIVVIELDKFFH